MISLNDRIEFKDKKNDVLTVGELLVDMISMEYSEDFECDSYNKYFGGSPANIAMNTNRLGINSLVAAAVGNDGLGRFLVKHLENAKIDTSCVEKVDYSTSMVLVTKSKSSPVPIFYRDADYHLNYTNEIAEALKNSKILHFSCWPISRQPSRNTIEIIIEQARKNDVLICFDPNYHKMIWEKDEDGVEYVKSIIKKTDIVKYSKDDAERLFGIDTPENQMEKFKCLGAKLSIMTLGKDGAIVSDGKETIKFNAITTEVVDTTGAGDALWSGFYAALIKGYTIKDALNLGLAVSAYKLKYTGAVVNLPKLEEIKRIYNL